VDDEDKEDDEGDEEDDDEDAPGLGIHHHQRYPYQ
jgi:hypothetical protein